MQFMVEAQLKPGTTRQAVEAFEQRGPNRSPGVSFRGAWVDGRREVVYVLIESADENLVREASRTWAAMEDCKISSVVPIDQY